ncbi:MAG TPA: AarF/UbiB family protein [Chitinophagaceae bacterium]|nr:AarF/UbiB family protein [Chitinophagaceae bacterium]
MGYNILSNEDGLSKELELDQEALEKERKAAKELADDLVEMGPTYIKLGQLLSTRPDLLPEVYLDALTELQDDVAPIAYEVIEEIIQEELGLRISKAFNYFAKEPLASASIGQVHIAELRNGQKVAIKIQRPGIRKLFVEDLEVLLSLAEKAEKFSKTARQFSLFDILEELKYMLLQELNYEREADNLIMLKDNLETFPLLKVPMVYQDYCSSKVLTMELIEGKKVTDYSPLSLMDYPTEELVDEVIKGYLKQIIVDGFAHADPHLGNIHLTKDNKIALLDLGMAVRFSSKMQEEIMRLIIALSSNDGEKVAKILLQISDYNESELDIKSFKKLIIRQAQENEFTKAKDLSTGKIIIEINKIAAMHGIKLPVELAVLGKILLNLDQIIAALSPEHDLQKTMRSYVDSLMRQHMKKELKTGNLLENLLQSKELVESFPERVNMITENLANNNFKMKIKTIDEHRFILAFQKVANRITIGLIIAALILGAALLMRIPSSWNILGYPGFAMLFFIFAASIGLYLIYQILFKDENNS